MPKSTKNDQQTPEQTPELDQELDQLADQLLAGIDQDNIDPAPEDMPTTSDMPGGGPATQHIMFTQEGQWKGFPGLTVGDTFALAVAQDLTRMLMAEVDPMDVDAEERMAQVSKLAAYAGAQYTHFREKL